MSNLDGRKLYRKINEIEFPNAPFSADVSKSATRPRPGVLEEIASARLRLRAEYSNDLEELLQLAQERFEVTRDAPLASHPGILLLIEAARFLPDNDDPLASERHFSNRFFTHVWVLLQATLHRYLQLVWLRIWLEDVLSAIDVGFGDGSGLFAGLEFKTLGSLATGEMRACEMRPCIEQVTLHETVMLSVDRPAKTQKKKKGKKAGGKPGVYGVQIDSAQAVEAAWSVSTNLEHCLLRSYDHFKTSHCQYLVLNNGEASMVLCLDESDEPGLVLHLRISYARRTIARTLVHPKDHLHESGRFDSGDPLTCHREAQAPFFNNMTRAIDCFFCLSPSTIPTRLNRWQCGQCGCWNIRDKRGEMAHDLPAMHDPQLNTHSSSLRARPSSSHLPSRSNASPFCHSCSANQTLIMNMLANYLPDDHDPSFPALYDALPTYVSNLHTRYPPVCANCQPAVDAALKKSDVRAQTEAWGSALTRGSTRQATPAPVGWMEVLVWRIRAVLFCLGCGLSCARGILGISHLLHLPIPCFDSPHSRQAMLTFHLLCISWIAWDPYWLSRVKSRDRDVHGRQSWIRIMLLVLLLRLVTSLSEISLHSFSRLNIDTLSTLTFMHEVFLFVAALSSIRVSRPVPLQLVRPVATQTTTQRPPGPSIVHPPFDSLPLKDDPAKVHNPVFGKASFVNPPPEAPVEMMDWEPSSTPRAQHGKDGHGRSDSNWDTFAVGKQSMFPKRTEETGLESLLAEWGLSGPPEPRTQESSGQCIIA